MRAKLRDKDDKKRLRTVSAILCIMLAIGVCSLMLVLYSNGFFANSATSQIESNEKINKTKIIVDVNEENNNFLST